MATFTPRDNKAGPSKGTRQNAKLVEEVVEDDLLPRIEEAGEEIVEEEGQERNNNGEIVENESDEEEEIPRKKKSSGRRNVPSPEIEEDNNEEENLFKIFMKQMSKGFKTQDDSEDTKGISVRAPDKFTGQDRSKLRTFLAQCRLVFKSNPKKFKYDEKRVNYACSYLDDIAFLWYENFIVSNEEPEWFEDWILFESELQENFGVINAVHTAERKIKVLKMYNNNVINDYVTKFNTISNDLRWNDSALASQFRSGLPGRILDEISKIDTDTSTLSSLRKLCIGIDNRYWDRVGERYGESRPNSSYGNTTNSYVNRNYSNFNANNNYRTPFGTANSPVRNNSPNYPSSNNNLNRNNERKPFVKREQSTLPLDPAGKVNLIEKQRRIEKKLCNYCGGDHEINSCPKRQKTPQNFARLASITPMFSSHPSEDEIEEEDEEENGYDEEENFPRNN